MVPDATREILRSVHESGAEWVTMAVAPSVRRRNSSMIVFTYSGQGSQQPGMGAAWREHPSWELV